MGDHSCPIHGQTLHHLSSPRREVWVLHGRPQGPLQKESSPLMNAELELALEDSVISSSVITLPPPIFFLDKGDACSHQVHTE